MEPAAGGPTSRREFLKALAAGAVLAGFPGMSFSCGPSLSDKLAVETTRAREDEPFVVRLNGLSPGQRVVLSAAFDDGLGNEWSSSAVFEADGEGMVSTSEQAPVEGSYGVADPMGLVWSALEPGDLYVPSLLTYPLGVKARVGDEEASAEVERFVMGNGVERTEVREDGLVGTLFSPAQDHAAPAVLVLGGSEGGLAPFIEREAALLASEGFASLALAYFRGDLPGAEELPNDLPDELVEIPLEYFGRALEWLDDNERVDGERIGVMGHSRGGELALLLGASYQEVKAVVSYVGSGIVVSSAEGDEPAWTYRGEEVPRVPHTEGPSTVTKEQEKRAEIPVERINGPVFLVGAGDDALWPSDRLARIAMERLERHDRPYDDRLLIYPDAGHLIQAPYLPTAPGVARYGGEASANAQANEDAWRRTLALFREGLENG